MWLELTLALLLILFVTRPRDVRVYLKRRFKEHGLGEWIENFETRDLGLFTVATSILTSIVFVGVLGRWFILPADSEEHSE